MNRIYLADIIGDGTDEGGDFRAATADYPLGTTGSMPADPATGIPLNAWMLVGVFAGDVAALIGDARIDPLPDCALDTPVSMIDPDQLATMRAALIRRGIGVSIDTAANYGEIIAAINLRANAANATPAVAQLTL